MEQLLSLLVRDCLEVMRTPALAPETRMFAQVMARNITQYDPSVVSAADYRYIRDVLRVGL